ncbi:THAP-type domain-containing protein [Aphis craccivora]|uniref:THAP-type domain-containing protein n=1 Tax=Aphis craccivora TaxID=307492 RepID=A0A6G0XZ43_APHCR|nr:THAP-type domain-containing protein [Aphis craccivora]
MLSQWLAKCKRLDLLEKNFDNYRVRSKHFISKMYANPEDTILLPTAIPTKFESTDVNFEPATVNEDNDLDHKPVCSSTPSKSNSSTTETCVTSSNRTISESSQTSTSICTQTTQVLSVNTPRKKKMLTSVDHFNEVVDVHLPPNLAMLMKNYVKLASRKPQDYHFLKKNLQLPTPRTLRRITQKIEIGTGLNDILFNSMELKFKNLKEDAKDCVLCVDEMAIKTNLFYNLSKDSIIGFNHSSEKKTYEPAKHVLCFMVRSLNYKWKQPVAYYFINNSCTGIPLLNTIFAVISTLQSISVNIRVFTTDQGSNFYSFANKMYVTSERPYFFVNGFKIYYVFVAPHLLKPTRNNFFKYNLEVFNNMTDIKYLNDFYNADQGINCCAPKLTDAHINPSPFQKMKVSYAFQFFSATVAASMRSCVEYGKLPHAAETTVNFIEYMDKLFDILNSRTKAASKELNLPLKKPLTREII